VSQPPPRRGRQAEAARNDRRVLDAARAVFAAQGFGAPVAAVAERAGVGIGTLYRRYGTKDELLQNLCVLSLAQNFDSVERAVAHDDPWAGLCGYVRECVELAVGAFSPLAGEIEVTDEMSRLAGSVHRRVARLVRQAQARGALRRDVNAVDILQLIERFGRAFPPTTDPRDHLTRRRQVEIALDGLRSDGARQPLSGPAPTSRGYQRRWSR
jgi:AcrR family transcriptional regulator